MNTNTIDYITLNQAEKQTGLSKYTLKTLIRTGKVTGTRPGHRTYLVKYESLINYLEDNIVKPIGGEPVVME